MTDGAGVPQTAEVAERIANSIGPASKALRGRRHLVVRSGAASFSAGRQTNEGVEMSTEPALMSLVAVAKAIASKEVSSREVTRSCLTGSAEWQPRLNAFHGDRAEAGAGLKAADEADAALAKARFEVRCNGVPLAHKDMYYDEGKVVTCGSLIGATSSPPPPRPRCSAEGCRPPFVTARCRWWSSPTADRP